MNALDELIRQSNILLEVIDNLIELIKKAQDNNKSEYEMVVLINTINKTKDLTKSFMDNYNEFIQDYTYEL